MHINTGARTLELGCGVGLTSIHLGMVERRRRRNEGMRRWKAKNAGRGVSLFEGEGMKRREYE